MNFVLYKSNLIARMVMAVPNQQSSLPVMLSILRQNRLSARILPTILPVPPRMVKISAEKKPSRPYSALLEKTQTSALLTLL